VDDEGCGKRTAMTRSADRLAYTSAYTDRVRDYLDRSAEACLDLATRYTELHGRIAGGSPLGTAAPQAFGRPPLRLDVVDTLQQVASMTDHHVSLARGALRLGIRQPGPTDRPRTVRGLTWLARAFGLIFDADPPTAREAARDVFHWSSVAGLQLGIIPRAFRIRDPCPECGGQTLVADPLRWLVSCVRGGCGFAVPVDDPVLVWSTGSSPFPSADVVGQDRP
jgi:hypothetical protein